MSFDPKRTKAYLTCWPKEVDPATAMGQGALGLCWGLWVTVVVSVNPVRGVGLNSTVAQPEGNVETDEGRN